MEVIHRDLKPGNIVLDANSHLKLIDFATCKVFNPLIKQKIEGLRQRVSFGKTTGLEDDTDLLSNSVSQARQYSLVGTEEYIAPETLKDTDLSYACDLWSLGVILYQLMTGTTPFKGKNSLETY